MVAESEYFLGFVHPTTVHRTGRGGLRGWMRNEGSGRNMIREEHTHMHVRTHTHTPLSFIVFIVEIANSNPPNNT